MRLRPRASSSDLDEARAIAERLERPPHAAAPPGAASYVRFGSGAGTPPERTDAPATPAGLTAEPPPAAPPAEPAVVTDEWPGRASSESLVGESPEPESAPFVGAAAIPETLPQAGPESLVEELVPAAAAAPPPPSWDSLVASARELALAQAAMLIGPAGTLLAASGGWPAAGPAAIAGKLLPMVAPRLQEPDALVPVKLAGQVLSVWRVSVGGRFVTVATLATQALPAAVRPEIDARIAQGSLDV
jgi:hypothetical protein